MTEPRDDSGTTRGGQQFRRAAGVALPLSSLRDERDVGSGEILDLVPFIDWLDHWHQRVVQLLPINEASPGEASPYSSLSAFAIDPTYIAATRIIDVERSAAAQAWLASSEVSEDTHRWRGTRQLQREPVYAFKIRLLEFGFHEFEAQGSGEPRRRDFERFRKRHAWWLDDYALFRALKEEEHWAGWEHWPLALQRRDPQALGRAAAALETRRRFFQYVQWIAAEQWAAVRAHAHARNVAIKGDLPFACGRDSADVWAHQNLFDLTSSAGAPPDDFSATGQAWGLPLYNWAAMRAANYTWWRQRARQARMLYDIFRIDHVVGLYRTYAIPEQPGGTDGFVPRDEDAQRTQGEELLRAVLAEAGGAATVAAEDLGTVPDWVRQSLIRLAIPGYKVFRWEKRAGEYLDPRMYPALSIATTGTHDTNTLAAWWDELRGDERVAVLRALDGSAPACDPATLAWVPEIHLSLLRRLYESGSVLTIIPIQDLFGWVDRINTPATTGGVNWTYRLPMEIGALDKAPAIRGRMTLVRALIDQTERNTLADQTS